MSCHDIGHGVDFIIQNVLDMYEHGEISKEAALKMIRTFPQAVHYCDGNESEALGEFRSPYEVWDAPQENGAFTATPCVLPASENFSVKSSLTNPLRRFVRRLTATKVEA